MTYGEALTFDARTAAIAYSAGWEIEDLEGRQIYEIHRRGTFYFGKIWRSHLTTPDEYEKLTGLFSIPFRQMKFFNSKRMDGVEFKHIAKHLLENGQLFDVALADGQFYLVEKEES